MMSAAITMIAGFLSLFRYQENSISYRSAIDALKREKMLFLTRSAPYNGTEPFSLFVERVESMLNQEHSAWSQARRPEHANNQKSAESAG